MTPEPRMIRLEVASGLAQQAMREAMNNYGLMPGTRAAIVANATLRMQGLLDELDDQPDAGQPGPTNFTEGTQ